MDNQPNNVSAKREPERIELGGGYEWVLKQSFHSVKLGRVERVGDIEVDGKTVAKDMVHEDISDFLAAMVKPEVSGWMPIEAANRTGSAPDILVYDDTGNFHVVTYYGNEEGDGTGEHDWFNGDVYVTPTHWMPLPAAPQAAQDEGV